MKRFPLLALVALLAVLVASCSTTVLQPPVDDGLAMSSASSTAGRSATVEGVIQKAGVSIYMQGSHRLQMDDGTFLLLESTAIRLDDYVDERVIVTGTVQPTVEAGGIIMDVELIGEASALLEPEVLEEVESSSSRSAVSSPRPPSVVVASSPTSSPVPVPAPVPVRSSPAPVRSSPAAVTSSPKPAPLPSSSSPVAQSSPAAAPTDYSVSVNVMAKATVDAGNFTTKYCSSHIGFCLPIHRNWYFQSFGAKVSPYLWHVEVSDQSVEDVGQGVIVVNLVSGPLEGSEGVAVDHGDFVVASRQWTGNRHIEVSGPKELRRAVEFMANGVEVYQPAE